MPEPQFEFITPGDIPADRVRVLLCLDGEWQIRPAKPTEGPEQIDMQMDHETLRAAVRQQIMEVTREALRAAVTGPLMGAVRSRYPSPPGDR